MNYQIIEQMAAPFYDQFAVLGELFEDSAISYGFLRQSRRCFSRQYFFELKRVFKADRRQIKRQFRRDKAIERAKYRRWNKRRKGLIKAVQRAQRAAKREAARERDGDAQSLSSGASGAKAKSCRGTKSALITQKKRDGMTQGHGKTTGRNGGVSSL